MLSPQMISRYVTGLIIVIFVLVTPGLLLAYNTQQTVTRREFYNRLLDSPTLFEAAIPEIAEELVQAVAQDPQARQSPTVNLSAEDWETIIQAVAPPEWLQSQAQKIADAFFNRVHSGEPFLESATISLGQARDRLLQDPQRIVLNVLVEAQPPCMAGQEFVDTQANLLPACRPPETPSPELYERLWQRWQGNPQELWSQLWPGALGAHSDDISLAEWIQQTDADLEAQIGWRSTRWALQVSGWLVLSLIGLQGSFVLTVIGLLLARSWREWLRWGGIPLVVAGFLSLLLGGLLLLISREASFTVYDVSDSLAGLIDKVIRAFLWDTGSPLLWQGGLLTIAGAGMWLLSFLWPQRSYALATDVDLDPESAGTPDQSEHDDLLNSD